MEVDTVQRSTIASLQSLELHEAMTVLVLSAEWLSRHHSVPLEGVAAMFLAGVASAQGFLERELH